VKLPPVNPISADIGRHVAGLIEDGSTIRVGVAAYPPLRCMRWTETGPGVHADMLTDAYLHLVKHGVITNARKTLHPGRSLPVFAWGPASCTISSTTTYGGILSDRLYE